ncbi:SAM-dependent methyltransferase [Acidobacteria bacterium AH-259-G07]|nr:SAM-dependent methyltransferase [Acidobacteria bacterium AH-259-G07]
MKALENIQVNPTNALQAPIRPSVPGPGRSLFSLTEERAKSVRRAVRKLEEVLTNLAFESEFRQLFFSRWLPHEGYTLREQHLARRAAWTLVNTWILARKIGVINQNAGFLDSENWFLDRERSHLPSLASKIPVEVERQALELLSQTHLDHNFFDLLPYILEPHGPGTRLTVLRDPTTRQAREIKKRKGVFYTPADVAEYMVSYLLRRKAPAHTNLRCLDPCCGTGVFLLAMMRVANALTTEGGFKPFTYSVECLYGLDVDPLVVESCTFVLLHECLSDALSTGITPWAAWHALSLNLCTVDSLNVFIDNSHAHSGSIDHIGRQRIRRQLLDPRRTSLPLLVRSTASKNSSPTLVSWLNGGAHRIPLQALFPEVPKGFDLVIGNPPYTSLGNRNDLPFLSREYETLTGVKTNGNENAFLLFIEMMWRLAAGGENSSAMVVPLSISYHQGRAYKACRKAMTKHGSDWRFAFFDREPHALFGEEVKTRNAILFRVETYQTSSDFQPYTTSLYKWTSRTRKQLFSSIRFTKLSSNSILSGIPKLSGDNEAKAYQVLSGCPDSLRTLWQHAKSCTPLEATRETETPKVFIASTAYNFLNVFRSLPKISETLSKNKLLSLEFDTEEMARVCFAVLSSRLVYWLWRVRCDGFHVPRTFVEQIPFGRSSFQRKELVQLSRLGARTWEKVRENRTESLNGGRKMIAHPPDNCEVERDGIDKVLLQSANISSSLADHLRTFLIDVVVVDDADERRRNMSRINHISGGERR